jgi:Predicted transcriptional regulator, contains C-terminal CBS domains
LFFIRGFTSDRDDKRMNGLRLRAFKANDIMTSGLATMEPDEKINIALEVFKENLFHAIPIVEAGKLVGIVTTFDIIVHVADDLETVKKYN